MLFVSFVPVVAHATVLLNSVTDKASSEIGTVDRNVLDTSTSINDFRGKGHDVLHVDCSKSVGNITLSINASCSNGGVINSGFTFNNPQDIYITRFDCKQGYSQWWAWAVKKDMSLDSNRWTLYGGGTTGSITFNSITVPDSSLAAVYVPPVVSISGDDILNYNWTGDGLKIYNLKTGMNVSGYVDNTIKYFDIECYGKFIYKGSNTFFTSFAYKKMQTSIQLASCMNFGSESRTAGEGLGIKSFDWVSNKDQLNTGDEVRFRIVYQAPLISKGVNDIAVGTTINNGLSDSYISDKVTGVNFLNSNWVYNEPLDTSGETGNVGTSPGNSTWAESNSTNPNTSGETVFQIITDTAKSVATFSSNVLSVLQNVGTIAPQLATLLSSMFSFLPTPIPQLITSSIVLIIFIAVIRFLRG